MKKQQKDFKERIREFRKPHFAGITLSLVLLRFIPLYKLNMGFISERMNLNQLHKACSLVGGVLEGCGVVTFVNVMFWLALIFFGGVFIYTNRKLIVDNVKDYIKKLN